MTLYLVDDAAFIAPEPRTLSRRSFLQVIPLVTALLALAPRLLQDRPAPRGASLAAYGDAEQVSGGGYARVQLSSSLASWAGHMPPLERPTRLCPIPVVPFRRPCARRGTPFQARSQVPRRGALLPYRVRRNREARS